MSNVDNDTHRDRLRIRDGALRSDLRDEGRIGSYLPEMLHVFIGLTCLRNDNEVLSMAYSWRDIEDVPEHFTLCGCAKDRGTLISPSILFQSECNPVEFI